MSLSEENSWNMWAGVSTIIKLFIFKTTKYDVDGAREIEGWKSWSSPSLARGTN